jgi:hypothetical protein
MPPQNRQAASGPDMSVFDPKKNATDFFFYTVQVSGLQPTAPNGSGILQMDSDSDFYLVAMSYQADIAGAAQLSSTVVVPLVTIQISDTGSGRSMFNTPAPLPSVAGSGQLPYRLVRPRVFNRNATINIQFASYVAAGTIYDIFFTLHGWKKYTA